MAWFENIESTGPKETKRRVSTRSLLLVAGLAIVAVAAAGFFIARALTGSSSASATSPKTITPKAPPSRPGTSPFGRARVAAAGTIGVVSTKSSDGHSFTMKTTSGSIVTVDVSATTTYRSRTSAGLSFSSLAVGDTVVVTGTTHGSTLQATAMLIAPAGSGRQFGGGGLGRGGATFGSVSAINSAQDSFTLTTRTGTTTTVDVSSSTIYRDLATGTTGSFSSIAVGDRVVVTGSTNSSGVVEASVVDVVPSGSVGGGFGGGGGGGFGGGFGPGSSSSGNTGAGSPGAGNPAAGTTGLGSLGA